MDSWTQLQAFVRTGSDEAFEAVVSNHIDMVYATALRKTGKPDAAHDIAQSTFILLAEKASQLKQQGSLGAWLHRSALFKSMEWIKHERLRNERQQPLPEQIMLDDQPDQWGKVEPLLDEAVDALRQSDRELILGRFFQKLSLRELGVSLGISEEAARKRVSRCIDQMKQWFHNKGIGCSSVSIATCLSHASTQAAPTALMTSVLKNILTIQTASTFSINSVLNWLLLMKTKTILITGVGIIAVTSFVWVNRNDSVSETPEITQTPVNTADNVKIDSGKVTTAPIMQQVEQLQSARSSTERDPNLLSEFQNLLYSKQMFTGETKDPARTFLDQIPVADRLPYWSMIKDALEASPVNVRIRATVLLPLMWPEHAEALPKLYDRLRSKDSVSGALIGATYYALGQIIKEPEQFNEVFHAAMEGSELARKEMAIQTPVLISGIKGDRDLITHAIQAHLQSPHETDRLLAAQVLAQTKGSLVDGVVEILANSLSNIPDTNDDLGMFNLSLLWKLGPKAESAVPLLLELADQNPDLGDMVDMALKNIRPKELEGFAIQTPLPQLDAQAQSLAEELRQNPNQLNALIQSMESGQSTLSDALALATLGEQASPALPVLQSRLMSAIESNPQEAMVIGAVIERLQPDKAKSILTAMDLIPAMQGMDLSFANKSELGKLQGSLAHWGRQLMQSKIIMQQDLPNHAEQLKDIHPNLYEQFKSAMLKQDSRWKAVLK